MLARNGRGCNRLLWLVRLGLVCLCLATGRSEAGKIGGVFKTAFKALKRVCNLAPNSTCLSLVEPVATSLINLAKGRIYQGMDATEGDAAKWFPHNVRLDFTPTDDPAFNKLQCLGSLLKSDIVITAGRCVYQFADPANFKPFKVVASERFRGCEEPERVKSAWVTKVILHPEYRWDAIGSHGSYNDLALLKLKTAILASEFTSYANLPYKDWVPVAVPEKKMLLVPGFGTTAKFSGAENALVYSRGVVFPMGECGSGNSLCIQSDNDTSPCMEDIGAGIILAPGWREVASFLPDKPSDFLVGVLSRADCKAGSKSQFTPLFPYVDSWLLTTMEGMKTF